MNIINIKVQDLIEADYNPRIITTKEFDGLKKSIETFGFVDPIIVNKDMTIIGGHQRYQAAKLLNITEVPCNILDLSKHEEKKLNVLLNSHAISGKYDDIKLAEILEELKLDNDYRDLNLNELEPLDLSSTLDEVTEDDYTPPAEAKYKVEIGDVYELGNHRLMCGDSVNIEHIETLMAGNKADMIFTDPPYGYKYQSNHQSKFGMLKNDDVVLDFLGSAILVLEDNSPIYICGGWQSVDKWTSMIKSYVELKNIIIWKKNNWSMGDLKGAYAGQYEIIFFAHKGRVELSGGRDRDVWEFNREPPTLHPTMKPIELIGRAIKNHASRNILDLFGGSGSTLIACEQLNRKCCMMELDPYYCSIIIERWEKQTNKQHKKITR